MKKLLSVFVALLFGASVAGASMNQSQPPVPAKGGAFAPMMMQKGPACPKGMAKGYHRGGMFGCPLGRLVGPAIQNAAKLGLTDAQVKELRGYALECKKIKILEGAKVKVAGMELHRMMDPLTFDLKAVKAQIQKKMSLIAGMTTRQMGLYEKALTALTPAQLKQLSKFLLSSSSVGGTTMCPVKGGQSMKAPMGMKACPKHG